MTPISFLLVDDEHAFIETIARRLRQRGYEVECVFSGQAALDRLEKGGIIDVVVLDMKMLSLDGIQAVQQIRRNHFQYWSAESNQIMSGFSPRSIIKMGKLKKLSVPMKY